MEVTTFLAVWGALLSTALGGWTIFRDLRDRAKLQLDVMIGNVVPGDDKTDYLFITITNAGRRPVVIKSWAFHFEKREGRHEFGVILPRGLPRMLKEGEYHMEQTHEIARLLDGVIGILVYDSAGRKWKVPKNQVREVIKEVREIEAEKKKSSL